MKDQHLAEALEWMRSSLRLDPHPLYGQKVSRDFFEEHPQLAALSLLGSILAYPGGYCMVVETEAYLDACDPASRASKSRRGRIARRLQGPPGILLVYGMHRVWLVNIVSHPPGRGGAVLIRACLHPHVGAVEGPGRVARLLGASRDWDGTLVSEGPLAVLHGALVSPGLVRGLPRVGVRHDLPEPMRYALRLPGVYMPKHYRPGSIVESCRDYPVMKFEDILALIAR